MTTRPPRRSEKNAVIYDRQGQAAVPCLCFAFGSESMNNVSSMKKGTVQK